MKRHKGLYSASLLSAAAIALFSAAPAMARDGDDDRAAKAAARADATLDRMTQVEKIILTDGIMQLPLGDAPVTPPMPRHPARAMFPASPAFACAP